MGRLSRTKGHAFERHVATTLRPLYPEARRGLSQSRAGHEVCDVENTPFRIECKHGASPSLFSALTQAQRDATTAKDTRPVLVVARKNGGPDVVMLRFEDFLALLPRPEVTADVCADPTSER